MHRIDSVVVGAGVVGLAAARALAQAGREVVVLEATHGIGNGTSSRNSEVIHAGLYYPGGSLKARLCVDGRRRLYDYCAERGIPHRRCGKLVVATAPDQLPKLEALHRQGLANGVEGLRLIERDEALALEPQLSCIAALESAQTGIIDSHALMLAYQGDAESQGAMIAFGAEVLRGRVTADGIELDVGGDEPTTIVARELVNCAGLHAPQLAASIDGLEPRHVPTAYYCKGSYFSLTGRSPFSRLVYPMHDSAGLGVHLTLDLGGQARFGPDTEWVDSIDYRVDPARCASFYAAIRRYWPGLRDDSLQPGYSGIRPKIVGEGQPAADFVIQGPREHGVAGLVNLYGIESPGLTSSLALADEVLRELG